MEEGKKISWDIGGMDCNACAVSITRVLEKNGMQGVRVDFAGGTAKFNAPENSDLKKAARDVEGLGYRVLHADIPSTAHFLTLPLSWSLWVCSLCTFPLLLPMWSNGKWELPTWLQLALVCPVMLVGVLRFGRNAWKSMLLGVANMDVLIFAGSSAAFIYSVVGGLILQDPNYLFFETAAVIITLVLWGNFIEQKAVRQTRTAIQALRNLQPRKATRINFYGNPLFEVSEEVDASLLQPAEVILIRTGEQVPADGVVLWGQGSTDESMITGESMPVEKKENDRLTGATTLVNGTLKMRVTAVGEAAALHHIIELVSDAGRKKPRVQKLADRITGVFVPVVVAIALLTFILSLLVFRVTLQHALLQSIAVLVVACPCAMGLATPTAVMVGAGKAARAGILLRGADTIQALAEIKTVVFDKTGTLTTGAFRLSQIIPENDFSREEIETALVSLEHYSKHPLAVSICKALAGKKSFPLLEVVEEKGSSIRGRSEEEDEYVAGSYALLTGRTDGSHQLAITRNGRLMGCIDLSDELRPGVKTLIQQLQRRGIRCLMLSGDQEESCRRIAQEAGLTEYYAAKKPAEKLAFLAQLQLREKVAMVGDGVNDAPALALAAVGVSLSQASQVAMDAAQVILLNGQVSLLAEAISLCKVTMQTIRQNFFWAFLYNVLTIPVAACGFLSPMIGAFSMAFSDVIVIGNSLRLKWRRI